jgi:hypothetical protein
MFWRAVCRYPVLTVTGKCHPALLTHIQALQAGRVKELTLEVLLCFPYVPAILPARQHFLYSHCSA